MILDLIQLSALLYIAFTIVMIIANRYYGMFPSMVGNITFHIVGGIFLTVAIIGSFIRYY